MSCVCSPSLCRSKLLPPGLVSAVRDGPGEAAVAALAQSSETPERVWNRSMQRAAAEEVAHLAAVARAHQASVAGRLFGCVGALASAVRVCVDLLVHRAATSERPGACLSGCMVKLSRSKLCTRAGGHWCAGVAARRGLQPAVPGGLIMRGGHAVELPLRVCCKSAAATSSVCSCHQLGAACTPARQCLAGACMYQLPRSARCSAGAAGRAAGGRRVCAAVPQGPAVPAEVKLYGHVKHLCVFTGCCLPLSLRCYFPADPTRCQWCRGMALSPLPARTVVCFLFASPWPCREAQAVH